MSFLNGDEVLAGLRRGAEKFGSSAAGRVIKQMARRLNAPENGFSPKEPEPYGLGMGGAETEQETRVNGDGHELLPSSSGPTYAKAHCPQTRDPEVLQLKDGKWICAGCGKALTPKEELGNDLKNEDSSALGYQSAQRTTTAERSDLQSKCLACGHEDPLPWDGKCRGCGVENSDDVGSRGVTKDDVVKENSDECELCGQGGPLVQMYDKSIDGLVQVCKKCEGEPESQSGLRHVRKNSGTPTRSKCDCETLRYGCTHEMGGCDLPAAHRVTTMGETQNLCRQCYPEKKNAGPDDIHCQDCQFQTKDQAEADAHEAEERHQMNEVQIERKNAEPAKDKVGRHGYIGFYKGKQYEVYADSSYGAQKKLAAQLRAKRESDVSVNLAEKDVNQETGKGTQVTTTLDNAGHLGPESWELASIDERCQWLEEAGQDINYATCHWTDLSLDVHVALQDAYDMPASRNNALESHCQECGLQTKNNIDLRKTSSGILCRDCAIDKKVVSEWRAAKRLDNAMDSRDWDATSPADREFDLKKAGFPISLAKMGWNELSEKARAAISSMYDYENSGDPEAGCHECHYSYEQFDQAKTCPECGTKRTLDNASGKLPTFIFADSNGEEEQFTAKDEAAAWEVMSKDFGTPVAEIKKMGIRFVRKVENGLAPSSKKKCPTCDGPVTPTEGVSGSNSQYTCKRCAQDFDETELVNSVTLGKYRGFSMEQVSATHFVAKDSLGNIASASDLDELKKAVDECIQYNGLKNADPKTSCEECGITSGVRDMSDAWSGGGVYCKKCWDSFCEGEVSKSEANKTWGYGHPIKNAIGEHMSGADCSCTHSASLHYDTGHGDACSKCGCEVYDPVVRCKKCGDTERQGLAVGGLCESCQSGRTNSSRPSGLTECQGCGTQDQKALDAAVGLHDKDNTTVRWLCPSCVPSWKREGYHNDADVEEIERHVEGIEHELSEIEGGTHRACEECGAILPGDSLICRECYAEGNLPGMENSVQKYTFKSNEGGINQEEVVIEANSEVAAWNKLADEYATPVADMKRMGIKLVSILQNSVMETSKEFGVERGSKKYGATSK